MKRKILIAVYVILICITLKLIYNTIVNSILISKYNNGEYDENQAKALTYINFEERYVAHYNYGNVLYQNGEYKQAIEEYKKALDGIVPKYKKCSIRINYALAICHTVQVNEMDQDSIKSAIEEYESAIDVLTKEGCDEHSQKANELKKDIQKEIDRLKKLLDEEDNTDGEDEELDENEDSKKEESIEETIQNLKKQATEEQRETEDKFNNFNKDYHHQDKNW